MPVAEIETVKETMHEGASTPAASVYRTKWLAAHNALHAAVHDTSVSLPKLWAAYLKEIDAAEETAATEA